MPRYVVCVPAESPQASVAPCGDVDGIAYIPSVVQLPAPGETDFSQVGELFVWSFSLVVGIWLVGLAIGSILSMVRDG